jgi:hypothetical protein
MKMGSCKTCGSVKKLEKAVGWSREGTYRRGKSAAMLFVRAGDCEGMSRPIPASGVDARARDQMSKSRGVTGPSRTM